MDRERDAQHYYLKSERLHALGQYKKSIGFCKRALTAESSHYHANFQWGRNLIDQGDYEKAMRRHREIITRDPENTQTYFNLGILFERNEKFSEAETQFQKSLSLKLPIKDASLHLVYVMTMQSKYTEAFEQCKKNIQITPDCGLAYNNLGYLNFIHGNYEEAIKYFEDAIHNNNKESLYYRNKSLALYCLDQPGAAIQTLKESPEKTGAENWSQSLKEDGKLYKGELERFERVLKSDNLGGLSKETMIRNIEGLRFLVDLINEELSKR